MHICIIVPIGSDANSLRVCIDSILNYSETDDVNSIELIGIPFGSRGLHIPNPQHWRGKFKIIRLESTENWCEAVNKGFMHAIQQGRTDYVVIMDSDVVVGPRWLSLLLEACQSVDKVGIVAPLFESSFSSCVYDEVDYVPNTCMILPISVLNEIGRFNVDSTQPTFEFCNDIQSLGYKIFVHNCCKLLHYGVTELDMESQPDMRKYIFVGLPNLGEIHPELVHALTYWTHLPQYVIKLHLPVCPTGFEDARNQCIKEFLQEEKWQYYFSLDADIIPPLDVLDQLMLADKDVMSAVSLSWRQDAGGQWFTAPTTVRYNGDGEYKHFYGEGVEEIDATGWACMLIKRRVLATIQRPVEVQYHVNGIYSLDGDYRGCQKMQEHGFKLYADYSLLTSHYKNVNLKDINNMAAGLVSGQTQLS